MTTELKVPAVGSLVRKVGGEILYRVVEASARGCYVEATVSRHASVPGRKAYSLHYSERRASLAATRTGQLIDSRWNCWEVVA